MQGFTLYDKAMVRTFSWLYLALHPASLAHNCQQARPTHCPVLHGMQKIQFAKGKSYATMKEDGSLSKHLAQKRKGKLPEKSKALATTSKSTGEPGRSGEVQGPGAAQY